MNYWKIIVFRIIFADSRNFVKVELSSKSKVQDEILVKSRQKKEKNIDFIVLRHMFSEEKVASR